MNIGIVHGSNDLYGASNVLLHDVAALIEMGHHVAARLPYAGPLDPMLRALGCEVECAHFPVLRRSDPLDVFRSAPLRKIGILAAADLAVAHTIVAVPPMIALAGRRNRPRIITSVHGIFPSRAGRGLARLAGAVSDGFLTNSMATHRWVRAATGTSSPVEMAYPVAPPYRHRPDHDGTDSSRPTQLILAGRVSGRKGHLELAMACDRLRSEGYDIFLTLAGGAFPSTKQARALDAVVAFAADREWIDYAGELSPAELLDLIAEHDLHVVAATDPESFGLVIVEAWSRAVPSLAPAVGGAAEATSLVEGIAYLPAPGDRVSSLMSALRFLLGEQSLLARPRADAPVSRRCTTLRRMVAWNRLIENVR